MRTLLLKVTVPDSVIEKKLKPILVAFENGSLWFKSEDIKEIQLPTDEEINLAALRNSAVIHEYVYAKGAKWMLKQITK